MAKRRKTVDNDHYNIVVTREIFGWYYRVALVSEYGTVNEETHMRSEAYFQKKEAIEEANKLGAEMSVELIVEGWV